MIYATFQYFTPNNVLLSPGDLLIVGPQGQKTGYDPIGGISYNEIANSGYGSNRIDNYITGEPGSDSKELSIWRPIDGEYELIVTGTGTGTYNMNMYVSDRANNSSRKAFKDIPITPGEIQRYTLNYSRDIGSKFEVVRVCNDKEKKQKTE